MDTGTREIRDALCGHAQRPQDVRRICHARRPAGAEPARRREYLHKVLDGEAIAARIGKMQWARIELSHARFSLLTSDQPLDVPLSLADKNAYVALPLSPTAMFVASNNKA